MLKRSSIVSFFSAAAVLGLASCGGGGGSAGTGASDPSLSTPGSVLSSVAAISAGDQHTLAVNTSGAMFSWGSNQWSQLGLGNGVPKTSPTQIGTLSTWANTAAGGLHSLGLRVDGTLWAWGLNTNGQLGDNTTTLRPSPVVVVSASTKWLAASAGDSHSVAIKADGSLWAWGRNSSGQLGTGTVTGVQVPTAITLSTVKTWTAVAAGANHTVAMRSDVTPCAGGNVYAWGAGGSGQLGQLIFTDSSTPTCVNLFPFQAIAIAAGEAHTLVIRSDGTLWGWGANASGQLGDGTTTDRAPLQIGISNQWIAIAAGGSHSVGIQRDASLWAWGSNGDGQLGNGTTIDLLVPTRVGSATNWRKVSAGKNYTAAIKNDGTLWTWGRNDAGQLGNGTTTTTPVTIP